MSSENDSTMDNQTGGISEEEYIFHSLLFYTIAPLMLSLFTIVGIIGNLIVVYVILTNKPMRNVTNILLLNLAVSDIAFLLVCGPFTAHKYASDGWYFGNLACQIIQYVLYVCVYVTIYTLVAISVYRYVTIVRGQKLQAGHNQSRAFQFIVGLWIVFMLLHIPTLLSHELKIIVDSPPPSPPFIYCGIQESSINPIFLSFFFFGYAIPLLIIATFYLLVVRYLRSQKPFVQNHHQSAEKRTTRTCRVIAIVVLAFGISWSPHHINAVLSLYYRLPSSNFYQVLRVVWVCMSYANSCVNPFIYNYASSEFRASFKRLFGCGKEPNSQQSVVVERIERTPDNVNSIQVDIAERGSLL